jgi:tetratricopeptide (TPR) repeat protein
LENASVAAADLDCELLRVAALLDSDPAAAARGASEILRQHPGHLVATLLLGTARRRCGDLQAAVTLFASLAAAQPNSALIQLELGRTLAEQGDPTRALSVLARVVELEPNLAEAWRELAALHAAGGDAAACDVAYARLVRLAPPDLHLAEAGVALANHRLGTAEALLRRQLASSPHDVAAMHLLARVRARREDYGEAERLLGECLKLAPGDSRARFELAEVLHAQQKAAPMLPLLERLLVLEPRSLPYRALQAAAFSLLGQNERAVRILAGLVAEFPDNELGWLYYGHALRADGRTAEAIASYRRSIALRAGFGEAWFSLANLKTLRFTELEIEAMQAQLAREELSDEDRLQFEFALGKALEDAGDFANSFAHYARGNALRRSAVPYDPERTTRLVQRTEALFTPEFLATRAGWGCPPPDPIFIVGLPRAGSTLIEQILASHSQVEGTRELPDITALTRELGAWEAPGAPAVYPQSIARLSRAELTALGERYLAQTRPHRLLGRPRFIDKMGNNFLDVGLIHLMLPNARIIDARRGALGCCFSNFKQHFQSGVWFSYSLEDLARYYRDYVSLMAHFEAVLPGRIHLVRYEELVTDFEGQVRRLLQYCGLPFEEQCLRFHETQRVVQTASSEQVRRPLYTESVDQWRNFEPWLGPLKQALGQLAAESPTAAVAGGSVRVLGP